GLLPGETDLLEEMSRILRRQVDELPARTALRRLDLRALERVLYELALRGLERNQQLGRAVLQREVSAHEVGFEHRLVRLVLYIREQLMLPRQQSAVANAHQGDARVVAISGVPEHVAIPALHRQHDRRLLHLLEVAKRVAQLGGALEVERLDRK